MSVAVLGSEFREQPRSADVAVGTDVLLGCRPPRGEPEPRVRWRKDSDPVRPDDRVSVSDTGTLRIRDAGTEDSAMYVCIAFNIGGEKESSPARLTVRGLHCLLTYRQRVTLSFAQTKVWNRNTDRKKHVAKTGKKQKNCISVIVNRPLTS